MKKKVILLLCLVVILYLLLPSWSEATYYVVCIDPGHGGSDSATVGPVYGVHEKDANLTVALALRDKILYYVYPVLMTRTTDETVSLHDRAAMANDSGAAYFISVHHNSSSDTSVNGTETYHCNAARTDSDFGYQSRGFDIMYGARDSTFAKKVRLALRDSLQHRYRCSRQSLCGDTTKPCCMVCYYVLRNTIMQSTLSEASFITNPWVEYQFYYNTDYIDKEAGAICMGWWSTYLQGGLGIVKNAYSTGSGSGYAGFVIVAEVFPPWTRDTVASPYEACWLVGSVHELEAITPQYIGDYWYTFHHWVHLWQGEPDERWNLPNWTITVPSEFDYHNYVAYFTGGPYSAQLYYPNGGELWHTCEQRNITWNASVGVDSTTRMNVYLSREGGSDFELLSADLPNNGSYTWKVSGLASQQCKIKVVAHDTAGNQASDVSDENFTIQGPSVAVTCPNGGGIWHIGEQRIITWSSAYICTTSHVDIYLSRDGGSNYASIISDLLNIGSYDWIVTGPSSSHCRIKVVVDDIFGNSAWDTSSYDFSISDTGNNNPAVDTGLHCKYPYTECNECIKLGESFTLEVHAHDLDGDSMYYEWHCGPPPSGGHFSNGQNAMTTAQNYVVYTAPSQKGKDNSDYLSVRVMDVRGGQIWTSGTLWIYDDTTSCICGDVNHDSSIDGGDLVFLLNYLCVHGPPPDPLETGDVNNDCAVDGGDLVYLLNYLFVQGPPPECCWIHY